MRKDKLGILFAILAALCYALLNPINKLISTDISPLLSASMLYIGTFIIASIVIIVEICLKKIHRDDFLNKKELLYLLLAVIFHVGATISLMFGLREISSTNASLLASFEIISTSLLAFFIFKENISKYLWVGIGFIFVACVIISLGDFENLHFSLGTLLCLISPICFGFASNFLKKVSNKNPAVPTSLLGLSGGVICLLIALICGERFTSFAPVTITVSLGILSYGIALIFFVYAERFVGASKTAAFFCLAPFIAIILSLIIFREIPNYTFFIGLGLLIVGLVFASLDAFRKKRS